MKLELRRVTVLAPGAASARREWPERSSVLIRLSDGRGNTGVGEAAPLPGYSRDTLADCEAALSQLEPSRVERALAHDAALDALAAAAHLLPPSLPAARFALEAAALDLLGQQRDVPAPELLGACRTASRRLSALVGNAADDAVFTRATEALQAGYACLKLKIGAPGALERELTQLSELRQRVGPEVALRLDANGALDAAELAQACPVLQDIGVELLEEPGAWTFAQGRLPLAADESLQGLDEPGAEAHLRRSGAAAVVLKPTALGGIVHCAGVARRASSAGVSAILSHTFDGPWAYRAAAALALALPAGPAHGLSPHAALSAFRASFQPCVADGELHVWTERGLGIAGGFD